MCNRGVSVCTRRRAICVLCIFVITSAAAHAQSAQAGASAPWLFLTLTPAFDIPLGSDASLYSYGWGASLSAEFSIPVFSLVYLGLGVGGFHASVSGVSSGGGITMIPASLDAGVQMELGPLLRLRAFGSAGYFYAFLESNPSSENGSNPYVGAGADLAFKLGPAFDIGLGVSYRNFLGLYNDLSVFVGTTYNLLSAPRPAQPAQTQAQPQQPKPQPLKEQPKPAKPEAPKGSGLDLAHFSPLRVFPVMYKFYSDHPIGTAVLHNWEKTPATDVRVSFLIKQYMDNPEELQVPSTLGPGEEKEIQLSGLLKSTILEVTEATLVSANITVEYSMGGKQQKKEIVQKIRILDRNGMNWDDNRLAAAFVTAKDPTILKFARNVTAELQDKANDAVNEKLRTAMGVWDALNLFGLKYVLTPKNTPHAQEKLGAAEVVDFLQFPQQTLQYKSGVCDDIAVLYAALLESVDVKTAFITTPGHIFIAFSLDQPPEEGHKAYLHSDELIFTEESSWVPVEITLRDRSFVDAWQGGAKEWRENKAKSQADLWPVHDAWKVYEPVGISAEIAPIAVPTGEALANAYVNEVTGFVDREIADQVAVAQGEIQKSKDPSKGINKLGVIYARYGLYDRAEKQFAKLVGNDYVPALLNMASLLMKRNDMKGALAYYERAQKKDPQSPGALLGVARVNHALENYGQVREAYTALKAVDPDLAARFSYLELRGEEATRAADASKATSVLIWEDGR